MTGNILIDSSDNTIGIDDDDALYLYGDGGIVLESGDGLSLSIADNFLFKGSDGISIFNGATISAFLNVGNLTSSRTFTFPDQGGTLALTSDIPAGGGDVTKVGTPVDNQVGVWTGDGTIEGDANFTWSGTDFYVGGNAQICSTDVGSAAAPELSLKRDSASPADGDYLGQIRFDGKNDNGSNQLYAKITGKTSDVTNGAEDGLLETAVVVNGTNTIVSRQTGTALKLINNVSLEVAGDITVTGTVDGRDVATDGTKLDTIETNADATDATNVVSSLSGATLTDAGVPATDDKVLIQDTSDSDNLKYVNISDLPSGGGGGDVTKVGTPVDNQIGVWTGDGTLEGDTGLTYDGSAFLVEGRVANSRNRSGTYTLVNSMYVPNMNNGDWAEFILGKDESMYDRATIAFKHVGSGSTNNQLVFGFYGTSGRFEITANGDVRVPGGDFFVDENIDVDGVVNLGGFTVATLPTGSQGDTAYVTDATSPTYLATVVGGGSVVCPVFYNGTNWVCH